MITIADALHSLRPNSQWSVTNGLIKWADKNQAQPTEVEIESEISRLQAKYDAKEYARKRKAEYPSFADQFDTLYHGGYDAWKAQIDAIKAKYPKP